MMYLAAQYEGEPNLLITEKKLPTVGEHDVIVEIQTSTICGTDINILAGNYESSSHIALGHEYSGIVKDKGNKVSSLEIDDLVTVEPHLFCGICKFCRTGKEHLCLKKKAFGVHMDGGFAQYSIVPDKIVYKVPKYMNSLEAALTENVGCCLHGIEQADIKIGNVIVIIGGGFVGIVLAELAKLQGASQVIVIEPQEFRREVIEKRGFTVFDPFEINVKQKIRELTNNLGADVVIEAAGTKETSKQCINYIGRGGTILFFGVVPPNVFIDVSPNDIYKRELKIVGSAINPYSHFRSLQIMKQLNLTELVTHHFALTEINEAMSIASSGKGIKIAIHPNGDVRE